MNETFKTRIGLVLALVGMAVGTGNIWRFPRVFCHNGGGTFLIPWALALLLWAIPLLIVEFSIGKSVRRGVTGGFHKLSGGTFTWLGGFVTICTLAIMCYYSVVTGWCLRYLGASISGNLLGGEAKVFWKAFARESWSPVCFQIIVVLLAAIVVSKGIKKGVEKVSIFMIPSLFLILLGMGAYALTLPGRTEGLKMIFDIDLARLKEHRIWLEAFSQSAWSTGAGWGLALAYASHARKQDSTIQTPFITGIMNNIVEILAIIVILPTMFTFFAVTDVLKLTDQGNIGLTFIVLPELFQKMQYGRYVATFFFLALFFAAFTSLVAMFKLGTSFLEDLGFSSKKALTVVCGAAVVLGTPSALNLDFFTNQDWVWGMGLLLSGFFFTLIVRKVGFEKFADEYIGLHSKWGRCVLKTLLYWVIPLEFFALVGWWFHRVFNKTWWNPFHAESIGTCILQWGVLLLLLFIFNRKLAQLIQKNPATEK